MSDIISPDTNLDLAQLAKQYSEVDYVHDFEPVSAFARERLLGRISIDTTTLITGNDKLIVSIRDENRDTILHNNVDLTPNGPALLVKPYFYDDPESHTRVFARAILRPLTEDEGRALILDIKASMKHHAAA